MTATDWAELLTRMLCTRAGQVLTRELARERAANIAIAIEDMLATPTTASDDRPWARAARCARRAHLACQRMRMASNACSPAYLHAEMFRDLWTLAATHYVRESANTWGWQP